VVTAHRTRNMTKQKRIKIQACVCSAAVCAIAWVSFARIKHSLGNLRASDVSEKATRTNFRSSDPFADLANPAANTTGAYPRIMSITGQSNTTVFLLPTQGRTIPREKSNHMQSHTSLQSNDKLIKPAKQIKSVSGMVTLANGTEHMQQCEPIEEWQTASYPTCNIVHELNVLGGEIKYISRGSIRSVWMAQTVYDVNINATLSSGADEQVILKTLRLTKNGNKIDFDPQRYESHRRDAMVSERLTSSPHIVDIYGFCGQSCINEPMAGQMPHVKDATSLQKLELAHSAVEALVDLHNAGDNVSNNNGVATIVHRDVTHRNYLRDGSGAIKLNDFNVGRFPEWDKATKTMCKFEKPDCGAYRSPEECEGKPLTEKIDIYSFGNILNFILTGKEPYKSPKRLNHEEIKQHIKDGIPSIIKDQYLESRDFGIQTLVELIHKCLQYNPDDRPTALQIEQVLSEVMLLIKENKRD
jgi:hypothetical protein